MRRSIFLSLALVACGEPGPPSQDASGFDAGSSEGCPTGFRSCDGTCLNVTNSPSNCGGCGVTCAAGELCGNGRCLGNCPGDLTECGQSCVDLSLSVEHCGMCGNACTNGMACMGGRCECVEGLTLCGAICVDTSRTPQHCGLCDRQCTGNQACIDGTCRVPIETDCNEGSGDEDGDGQADCADVDCQGHERACDCDPAVGGTGTQVCEVGGYSACGPCLPPECGGTAMCQAQGYECVDSMCVFDQTTLVDVELVNIDVPRGDLDGNGWDCLAVIPFTTDYEPDVNVEISVSGRSWMREFMDDQLNTTSYTISVNERTVRGLQARDLTEGIRVRLYDADGIWDTGCSYDFSPEDDLMGDCTFNIPLDDIDGRPHVYDCQRTSEAVGFRVRMAFRLGTSA